MGKNVDIFALEQVHIIYLRVDPTIFVICLFSL